MPPCPAGSVRLTVQTQVCGAGSSVTLESELNQQLADPHSILLGPYSPYTQYAVRGSQATVKFAVEHSASNTQSTTSAAAQAAASYFAILAATLAGLLGASIFARS